MFISVGAKFGVAGTQTDGHSVLVKVVARVLQASVEYWATVRPYALTAVVVHVIEDHTGPASGD